MPVFLSKDRRVSSLSGERWIRVMADYSADPLWDRDGCMAEVDDLPVSAALQERLLGWAEWYESNRAWEGDHSFDFEPFARLGLELARAVKRELPDWTVIYWDEAAYHRNSKGPRECYEYEIGPSG